jgi:hypothetical protein
MFRAASRISRGRFSFGGDMSATKNTRCRGCEHWREVQERVRTRELLQNAIDKIQTKLESEEFKPSIGDYVKLMQMEKEVEQEDIKEITVTWVEPVKE